MFSFCVTDKQVEKMLVRFATQNKPPHQIFWPYLYPSYSLDQKALSAKFELALVEVGSVRLLCPANRHHQKEDTWSRQTSWTSAEMAAPPWSLTRKPKGL